MKWVGELCCAIAFECIRLISSLMRLHIGWIVTEAKLLRGQFAVGSLFCDGPRLGIHKTDNDAFAAACQILFAFVQVSGLSLTLLRPQPYVNIYHTMTLLVHTSCTVWKTFHEHHLFKTLGRQIWLSREALSLLQTMKGLQKAQAQAHTGSQPWNKPTPWNHLEQESVHLFTALSER